MSTEDKSSAIPEASVQVSVPVVLPIKEVELPRYSASQVNEHNKASDLWIVIDGGVYDVTLFQHDHPGGVKGKLN